MRIKRIFYNRINIAGCSVWIIWICGSCLHCCSLWSFCNLSSFNRSFILWRELKSRVIFIKICIILWRKIFRLWRKAWPFKFFCRSFRSCKSCKLFLSKHRTLSCSLSFCCRRNRYSRCSIFCFYTFVCLFRFFCYCSFFCYFFIRLNII